ncbi:MAG: N-formylglutamate amidohydrolase [bacterium]|jgi:predicted N-formylglutamate amidohydrolase|nr:N-formylglutamate amidohydrolase [bacterium]
MMVSIFEPDSFFLLLTCEHGGNQVPAPYQALFAGSPEVLDTHRGYDLHILPVAHALAEKLQAPLYYSRITRLLVELNRSPWSPALFSEFLSGLSPIEKQTILDAYYLPFRQTVRTAIHAQLEQGRTVVHLSLHSFTPVWEGQLRKTDIGLLYDPAREGEKAFCRGWKQTLQAQFDGVRVRMNDPYRGTADGHVTALRKTLDPHRYLGIELEINQTFFPPAVEPFALALARSLQSLWNPR